MWQKIGNQLCAEFTFKDFSEAFAFMTQVALAAERQNHHPNWTNHWNKVSITLSTGDAGNVVTNRDKELADAIEAIYQKYSVSSPVTSH